jgi:hypothetical protein
MSNKTSNNGKNQSASNTTRPVGRPPVVLNAQVWGTVAAALKEQSNLATLAESASVSVPTMRRLLAEKYGSRIVFARGRNGGVTLQAAKRAK